MWEWMDMNGVNGTIIRQKMKRHISSVLSLFTKQKGKQKAYCRNRTSDLLITSEMRYHCAKWALPLRVKIILYKFMQTSLSFTTYNEDKADQP